MTNNDILKRIRYVFDYDDAKMIEIFAKADFKVTRPLLSNWMKSEEDSEFHHLYDNQLAVFLNGLINEKRGKKEGPQPEPENQINNNIILKKLKIALNLKTDDIIELFRLTEKPISPHELSAFLRNPKQSQYRPFMDQYLRNFLNGLQKKHRG